MPASGEIMVRHHIDLRVRRTPGGRFTGHVFTQAKIGDIESPLGEFTLRLARLRGLRLRLSAPRGGLPRRHTVGWACLRIQTPFQPVLSEDSEG